MRRVLTVIAAWCRTWVAGIWPFPKSNRARVLSPAGNALVQGGRQRPGTSVVRPSADSHFRRKGWRRRGRTATGYYRTRRGSWQGKIRYDFAGGLAYYVHDPPDRILNGPHGMCFTDDEGSSTSRGWYRVHFARRPNDVDSGLLIIEASLAGAR